MSPEAAAAPALRAAFEQAVAKAMPAALSPEVRLTRIFGARGDSSEVEFEARLAHGSSALALDRVEARIILLSVGGDSARHFEHGLLEALAAAGAKLPQGARVRVAGPKQVSPRKTAGRQLAASAGAPRRLHSAGSPMPSSARATAWIAVAICAVSAVVPALGLVAAIAATRRRFLRRNAGTLSSHLASELEVERIEEGCEGLAGKAECE
uniref:Uncharacterized protein n=1 Tax=Alexandrium andersonii TaxID=327968 RepID=A0A7S2EZ56_9DINO